MNGGMVKLDAARVGQVVCPPCVVPQGTPHQSAGRRRRRRDCAQGQGSPLQPPAALRAAQET
eukprot:9532134-Heterocapsa_arctica.AAC.1